MINSLSANTKGINSHEINNWIYRPRLNYYYFYDYHIISQLSLIFTGICLNYLIGYYGQISSRSELVLKSGIEIRAGVIDDKYIGKLKVLLFNLSDQPVTIKNGQ